MSLLARGAVRARALAPTLYSRRRPAAHPNGNPATCNLARGRALECSSADPCAQAQPAIALWRPTRILMFLVVLFVLCFAFEAAVDTVLTVLGLGLVVTIVSAVALLHGALIASGVTGPEGLQHYVR